MIPEGSEISDPCTWYIVIGLLCTRYVNANNGYIQWNLQTTDTLGAGVLSAVERLSLSRRFANKPRPSILKLLMGIYY